MTRRTHAVVASLLLAEFVDEIVFGAREAAWPQITDELALSYTQVGLLLAVPFYASAVLEPVFGVLGDSRWRRVVTLGGGVAMAGALALVAGAGGFLALLIAFAILFPATGAFVSLSQATLMDRDPARRDVNMTRWAVAGGVGAVAGPLLVVGALAVGVGWRGVFAGLAVLTAVTVAAVARVRAAVSARGRPSLIAAVRAVRRRGVVRWLVVLELADLLLDILLGFLALYFANEVAGGSARLGGVAIVAWTAAALAGSVALTLLLRRVDGLRYLRISAAAALLLYPAFLAAGGVTTKLALLVVLGVVTAGWYSVPKARLYDALSGQSGAAVALGSVAGAVGGLVPLVVGVVADRWSLGAALWLLLAAPVALLLVVPRVRHDEQQPAQSA